MKKCPYCGNAIYCLDLYCPYCNSPNKRYFTIEVFLKENFHLFTIIGVMGTMISLLPNLGNLIFGQNWLIKDDFNWFALFLIIIIYFGGLFITINFSVVFLKIFESRDDENSRSMLRYFHWRDGDLQRAILIVCFVPLMAGLILFIFSTINYIPNQMAVIGILLTLITIFILYLSLQIVIIRNLGKSTHRISNEFGKYRKHVYVLLSILVLGVLILISLLNPPSFTIPKPYSDDIKIQPNRLYYSPSTSALPGLGLEVDGISSDQYAHTFYNWSANYGYFISYSPSGMNSEILGNPCEQNSTKIYWTYSKEFQVQNKSDVKIELKVIDTRTNSIVLNKSEYLNLTWFSNDIVFVNQSSR